MSDAIALTWAERTIWLASAMSANPAAYNAACIVTIEGDLSTDRLVAALRKAVEAGALLAWKVVLEEGALTWRTQSVAAVAVDSVGAASSLAEGMSALSDIFYKSPLKADASRLIAIDVVKIIGAAQHLVLVRHHHVLLDFYANATFIRNVAAIYNDEAYALHATDRASIATAEQIYLASDLYREDGEYWRARMQGLGADALSPPLGENTGGRIDLTIPAHEAASFAMSARSMGSTPFQTLLLIVYAHLAAREEDVVLGVPFANRTPATANALASLSRIVPFRVRLSPGMAIGEALATIRRSFKRDIERARFPIWENAEHVFGAAPRGALPKVALNYMRTSALQFGAAKGVVSKTLYGERNAEIYIRCIEDEEGGFALSVDAASTPQTADRLGAALRAGIRALAAGPRSSDAIAALR